MKKLIIFAALVAAVLTAKAVEVSESEYARMIAATEAFERLKASDEKTNAGRIKWHGALVAERIDETRLVKVMVYADGFEHIEPYVKRVVVRDPKDIAAKRAARLAELKKRKPLAAAEVELKREDPRGESTVDVIIRPE